MVCPGVGVLPDGHLKTKDGGHGERSDLNISSWTWYHLLPPLSHSSQTSRCFGYPRMKCNLLTHCPLTAPPLMPAHLPITCSDLTHLSPGACPQPPNPHAPAPSRLTSMCVPSCPFLPGSPQSSILPSLLPWQPCPPSFHHGRRHLPLCSLPFHPPSLFLPAGIKDLLSTCYILACEKRMRLQELVPRKNFR